MNNKYVEWIQANLWGFLGCLYVPKKYSTKNVVVITFAPIILYGLLSIISISFFSTIFAYSNMKVLDGLSLTEKYWIGVKYGTVIMFTLYFIINLFRWNSKETVEYSLPLDDATSKYRLVNDIKVIYQPFISFSKFDNMYCARVKEIRKYKREMNDNIQNEVENQLNNIIKH